MTQIPNDFQSWPLEWPQYKQECYGSWDERSCDMLVGPCCCAAWHEQGEFEMRGGELYRYGKKCKPGTVRARP